MCDPFVFLVTCQFSLLPCLSVQVDRWGLVEGGHDVDIADLQVQISSAAVFLGLSQL